MARHGQTSLWKKRNARAASMSRVASPSFLCVLATAREVMWPCTCADDSSSLRKTPPYVDKHVACGKTRKNKTVERLKEYTFSQGHIPRSCHCSPLLHRAAVARRGYDTNNTANANELMLSGALGKLQQVIVNLMPFNKKVASCY